MLHEDSFIDTILQTEDLLEVFDIIYNSGGCIEAFHKHQGSRNVRLTNWQDGERTVSYNVLIPVPAIVSNIIGDELHIEEFQSVTWTAVGGELMPDPFATPTGSNSGLLTPGSACSSASDLPSEPATCFSVACIPKILSGGDRFVTELTFSFRRRAAGMGGGVRAVCSLKVHAKVWGLQGSIEPLMMAEAKKNLAAFFPFMAEFFHMRGGAAMLRAISGSIQEEEEEDVGAAGSSGSTATAVAAEEVDRASFSGSDGAEVFYDAVEAVPKGVRAAVQLFEGGKAATKRPAYRSRSPSPPGKLSRLPLATLEPSGSGLSSDGRTPRSAKSPLSVQADVRARWQPYSAADRSAFDTPPRIAPHRPVRFSKQGPVQRSGAASWLRDTSDQEAAERDRLDSARSLDGTMSAAGETTPRLFPEAPTQPSSANVAQTQQPDESSEGSLLSGPPDPCDACEGGPAEAPLSRHTDSSVQTESLPPLFFDTDPQDAAHSHTLSAGQSTSFESLLPDSCLHDSSLMHEAMQRAVAGLQDEKLRLTLECVSQQLGTTEQRIEELSARVQECVSVVHQASSRGSAGGRESEDGQRRWLAGVGVGSAAVGAGFVLGVAIGVGACIGLVWGRQRMYC